MITNYWSRRLLLCLLVAGLSVPATVVLARRYQAAGPSGTLSATGEVSVNGTSAISGATVFSDSTVTTAKGSSAVVSLGKLGRVEVMPDSTMKLNFSANSVSVSMLEAGRVRVSSSSGTGATATTKDGEISAKGARANEFAVDTSCGDTLVAVKKGKVELRAGNTVKQIAAGSQDSAGTATTGCKRAKR
jgi:ferric-dicitrate binding protein FerR (iron transport regulator)